MSKNADAYNKNFNPQPPPPEPIPKDSIWSRMAVLLWLSASITATIFSYQLGVREGKHEASEAVSPKQWLYYFENEEEEAAEGPVKPTAAVPASVPAASPAPAKEEKAPAVPASAQAAETRSGFAIQLITYASRSLAQGEVERLNKKGHQAFIVPSGKYFLVYMNLSKDRKTVSQKLGQLHKAGFTKLYPGAYVRSVNTKKAGTEN